MRFQGKKATSKDIISALEILHKTLKEVTRQDYALDGKLADYVFFPLSHVFKESKTIAVRATEVALQCLQILISRGWRDSIAPDLAKQLLILLSFLAGGSSTEAKVKNVNEELAAAAYSCSTSLFRASNAAGLSTNGSVDAANFPVLGHCISILLDGLTKGPSVKVRLGALNTLDAAVSSISDEDALKNFFPGMVSALTKLLSAGSRSKGSFKILQSSLMILDKIILKVANDEKNTAVESPESESSSKAVILRNGEDKPRDSWLEATSAQVKLALANILPLRYHEREEVRKALFQLCMSVLQRCQRSLHQSVPMMIETSLIICTQSSTADTVEILDNLKLVIATDSNLLEILQSSLRDWMVSLPRVMQSNDDSPKKRVVDQISAAFEIIGAQGTFSGGLDYTMTSNLHGSIAAAIQASASKNIQDVPASSVELSQIMRIHQQGTTATFPEIIFPKISQKGTIHGFQSLARSINDSSISTTLQQDIVRTIQATSGDEQLAALWLAIQLQSEQNAHNDMNRFVNADTDSEQASAALNDLYAFCLDALSEATFSTSTDWRLQALSLEAITLQAQAQRSDFRPELVDALYPILERLGSPNAALQRHALTALTLVSSACDYSSPKDLIISNVDYLVNAISLQINISTLSPQAPQVLIMAIKLCGATMIPYLDDLVDSIFDLLASYHGYEKFVEQMFGVLNAIVEEANNASSTAITETPEAVSKVTTYAPTSIASLAAQLKASLTEKPHLDPLPIPSEDINPSPSLPTSDPSDTELEDPAPSKTDELPPLSKTLTTISSILTLTQHHLPTSSPSLRHLLLNLLPHAFALLAPHTDTFLPLLNALYPVLTPRLYDPEPYITIAASHALTALCRSAGDFLRTRFEDEWERLLALWTRSIKEAEVERKKMGRAGASERKARGVGGLVEAVVEWVGVGGEMEGGVWDVVARFGCREAGVGRGVLEGLNADVLWLVEERERVGRGGKGVERPRVGGWEFEVGVEGEGIGA